MGDLFTTITTGKLTTSQIIKVGPCILAGYVLAAAAAPVTIIFYDNPAAASGKEGWDDECSVAQARVGVVFPGPIRFETGLWAEVSGAGVEYKVIWRPL